MQLKYFGANSWLVEWADTRILIDPWLVGDLVFAGQGWLFRGKHSQAITIPKAIDIILLSQGLEDHAHPETLEVLDRQTPIVASSTAAKVAARFGFQTIHTLKPGDRITLENLEIRAFPGAPVPQVENAYLLTDLNAGQKLYYEPHGFSDATVAQHAPIDVVINPIANLGLPLVGPIVQGAKMAPQLAQMLKPQYFLGTATGGDIAYDGWLASILQTEGSADELKHNLRTQGIQTQVIEPHPYQSLELNLKL